MKPIKLLVVVLSAVLLAACAGTRTFHDAARAGDSVSVAAGWMKTFTPDNLTVTIIPSSGSPLVFLPGDPIVRAVTNMYMDPLASIVVSRQTGQNLTPFATTYATTMKSAFTGDDKDWWQTLVILDLPSSLPVGLTQITISAPGGESAVADLDIVAGTGSPNPLEAEMQGELVDHQLDSLQRVPHYTVNFSSTGTLPYAVQVDLMHDPGVESGGSGKAYVVNPIGYIKNAAWSDDGTSTRVILTPSRDNEIQSMADFKFYVAGGINNLAVSNVLAFDINGDAVPGISAAIVQ